MRRAVPRRSLLTLLLAFAAAGSPVALAAAESAGIEIFLDGFENSMTSRWTATFPCPQTATMSLSGLEEVPPNGSGATGQGVVQVYAELNELHFEVTFGGLGGNELMAHIHGFAPIGMPAGVLFTLELGSPKIGIWSYQEGQESNILAGLTYFNIHSVPFPNGEIRGQIDEFACANLP